MNSFPGGCKTRAVGLAHLGKNQQFETRSNDSEKLGGRSSKKGKQEKKAQIKTLVVCQTVVSIYDYRASIADQAFLHFCPSDVS